MVEILSRKGAACCAPTTARSALGGRFTAQIVGGEVPHPGCFLTKSAEYHENKRVDFFWNAKKCKRVRKGMSLLELAFLILAGWGRGGYNPPHQMHEYQTKGLIKWAIHKRVILNGLTFVVTEEIEQERQLQKEKSGRKAPALRMEFSINGTIPDG